MPCCIVALAMPPSPRLICGETSTPAAKRRRSHGHGHHTSAAMGTVELTGLEMISSMALGHASAHAATRLRT